MTEIKENNLELKIKESIGEVMGRIDKSQEKFDETQRARIKELVESKLIYASLDDTIYSLNTFMNNFINYGLNNEVKLLGEVFNFYIDKERAKYIDKEETYSKFIKLIKEKLDASKDEVILNIIRNMIQTEPILEKDKTKYLVNRGSLENVTVFDKEKLENLKEKLVSLFDVTIKYEIGLISEEEYKVESSNNYFNINMVEEAKLVGILLKFSEYKINRLSGTKENADKIKKESKTWITKNKDITLSILGSMNAILDSDIENYFYLFANEDISSIKEKRLKELELEIENLKENGIIDEDPIFAKKLLNKINQDYNKLINS